MKKFLTIATVGVLVLALAAVTYAVDLKASGIIRNRTALYNNAEFGDMSTAAGIDDTNSFVDYRSRIKFDLVASEDLQGTIYFETNSKWGDTEGGDVGADGNTLVVKNAFISFKVPGTESFPTRLNVGVQGFYLREPFAIDDDAAGITIDTKIEPAELRLIYVKEVEDANNEADDVDLYGGRVTFPIGDMRPFVWFVYRDVGGGALTTSGGVPNSSSDLYWIGLGLDGKMGPVSFQADFAYNAGDLDYSVPVGALDKDEFGGYAFLAKASIPVAQFEVGGEFMYTTGDDNADITATKREFAGYRMPPGNAAYHPTTVLFSSGINDTVGITSDVQGGGIWMLKGFGSFKPLEWLKVTGYVAYLGDTEEDGDRFGTAQTAGVLEDNDDIGFELGVWTDIEVYKGLTYSIAAGWLSAGSALDQNIAGVNESPDDPWALVSNLQYKF